MMLKHLDNTCKTCTALHVQAEHQKTLKVQVSSALSADDSCDRPVFHNRFDLIGHIMLLSYAIPIRGTSNACGLGALQAAVHARSAKDSLIEVSFENASKARKSIWQDRSQDVKLPMGSEDRSMIVASLLEKVDAADDKSNVSFSFAAADSKSNGNEALQALEHLGYISNRKCRPRTWSDILIADN